MRTRDITSIFGAIILVVLVGFAISYVYQHRVSSDPRATSTGTRTGEKVMVYYPNPQTAPPGTDSCSPKTLAPVTVRLNGVSKSMPVPKAVQALISRDLTKKEKNLGFVSEFPHPDFRLVSYKLADDGELQLRFTKVPEFTSGGSCRMQIMRSQITKTAKQFDNVTDVTIRPKTIFQP